MAMPRKRPLENPNQYYSYVWRHKGKVLYVGYGKNNRCRASCLASWSRPAKLVTDYKHLRFEIEVEVFPHFSIHAARVAEKHLIIRLKPIYNTAPSYGGWKGMHTKEGKEKISKANLGKKHTEEFKRRYSERMLGNKNLLGHKHTEETKAKISKAGKGRSVSDLTRQKSRERMIERNRTNPPRKGKKCSKEHKAKVSIAHKLRNKNNALKN